MICKVCTQKSSVCARMYPAETKEMQYQINKLEKKYVLVCTKYIPVHTILKTRSMYQVHTFKLKYILQNIHF